jgi:hypothetical protein
MKLMKATLRRLWRLTRATSFVIVLVLVVAFVGGVVSQAVAAPPSSTSGSLAVLKGLENTVTNVTSMVGSLSGPILRLDNSSSATGATALDLQVESNNPPMTVNSDKVVTNLNSDQLDGKSADNLSRVAVLNIHEATTLPPNTEVTRGQQLSITAPAAGFVRVNGNVTVFSNGCTTECYFGAWVRHINTNAYSDEARDSAYDRYANVGLDAVFPVSAGVNTFHIRMNRLSGPCGSGCSSGEMLGNGGVLTAEYTPYGSTGTGTL